MNHSKNLFAVAIMIASLSSAWAQDAHTNHAANDAVAEPLNQDAMPDMNHEGMSGMDETSMKGMEMDHAMPEEAEPQSILRDPHAYADGYNFSEFPMRHEGGEIKVGSLRVDQLEAVRADGNTSTAYDVQAWHGADFDRAVLKAEGDIDNGELEEGRTELLWSHSISPFWGAQLGARYDNGVGPNRGWLAVGVQGLAPYWFEVDATAYLSDEGRSALRLNAEYELMLTQKTILQPAIEANFYGKRDAERELGAGLSDVTFGIRLRYEIRREFAPYIGIEWAGKYGDTADFARAAEEKTADTRVVAGVRFWF